MSWSNWRGAGSSPTPWTICLTSSAFDSWMYHNIQMTWFKTWNRLWVFKQYRVLYCFEGQRGPSLNFCNVFPSCAPTTSCAFWHWETKCWKNYPNQFEKPLGDGLLTLCKQEQKAHTLNVVSRPPLSGTCILERNVCDREGRWLWFLIFPKSTRQINLLLIWISQNQECSYFTMKMPALLCRWS